MPKLPPISAKEAIKALERLGFVRVRQRGSHVVLRKETSSGAIGTVVPIHKELASGTLRGIIRLAKVTPEQFLENLF
ncbi:MAG: type II toxin-antitoxin system HicA family toxin [Elusimicrobia bacterium]|nr:type II toxin-antitoxin system HicA family toxin [Elusimicrobiota bacterium]